MAKKKFNINLLLLVLVVAGLFYVSQLGTDGREARPDFDGEINDFSIKILSHDEKAEAGDVLTVNTEISNNGEMGGMFVQCSVLDETTEGTSWLKNVGTQSFFELNQFDNCWENEPYTQTGYLYLDKAEKETVSFTVLIPDKPIKETTYIYCAAYERCYSVTEDSYQSAAIKKPLLIIDADSVTANNNIETQGSTCETKFDCAWIIGGEECLNGYCVDKEDVPKEPTDTSFVWPKLDDLTIKDWAQKNKIVLIVVGLILLLIFTLSVFKKPKMYY